MKNSLPGLLLFISLNSICQHIITGNITDKSSGIPVEFVSIYNTTLDKYGQTNEAGNFSLQIANGDSVVISMVGFIQLSVIASEKTNWNIQLAPAPVELKQVVITPGFNTLNTLKSVELKLNPVRSSQEILQKVPGLFIAQHAGGGKAEQIFLRGFDTDHGTDLQITADGIPVNMVSHAHGQGYADLHFLIPETIQGIDFAKGPYLANKGNFATAGYVDFQTRHWLDESLVKLEAGRFNTLRAVSMIDLLPGNTDHGAYVASEYVFSDGPFESPQDFNRLNLFGKYTTTIGNNLVVVQSSSFSSKWNASGQIPIRAVSDGSISRFGAIDDTEGGETSRRNFLLTALTDLKSGDFMKTKAHVSKYDFELYSNFTFFLNDPVNGDQIRQKESRTIYGWTTSHNHAGSLFNGDLTIENGIGFRYDDIDGIELSHTRNKSQTLESIAYHDLNEFNGFLYADLTWEYGRWLVNAGTRIDRFRFESTDFLAGEDNRKSIHQLISPKLNLVYRAGNKWQFYGRTGTGFHSNDTRVVLDQSAKNTLPRAFGLDLGAIYKPNDRLIVDLAYWQMHLEQEFIYVGDEGIVEAGGRTRRTGLDAGLTYQLTNQLFLFTNLNYANPRSIDAPEEADHIPLAPTFTSNGGFTFQKGRFNGGVRYRHILDRPANEDNSITADGYFLADMNINYQRDSWEIGLVVENLLNAEWREAQFETESRLTYEASPVSEIHFTPGTPLFVKTSLTFKF